MADSAIVISTAEPFRNVQAADLVQGNRIAVEEIRHQDEVTIGRELVRYQL
jgi:hypothetical protein